MFVCAAADASNLQQLREDAVTLYQQGDYGRCANAWQQIADQSAGAGDAATEADAMIGLAAADQMRGDYLSAARGLKRADELAEKLGDRARKIAVLNSCGSLCTLDPAMARVIGEIGEQPGQAAPIPAAEPRDPRDYFEEAMQLAEASNDLRSQASIHTNLGNYLAENQRFEKAIDQHAACINLADRLSDTSLAANAEGNAATAAVAGARFFSQAAASAADSTHFSERQNAKHLGDVASDFRHQAAMWIQRMLKSLDSAPDSRAKVYQLITAGLTDEDLAANDPGASAAGSLRAGESFGRAIKAAEAIRDAEGLSYACGYLGQLYESEAGAYDQAMALTRRAVFAAEQASSDDSLYLWQWQIARLLKAHGEELQAIAAYRRASDTVKNIRNDIALGNGNQRSRATFRDRLGPLYYQLADLLLRRAEELHQKQDASDVSEASQTLIEARDSVEMLKGAELEDYLQDECVQLHNPHQQLATVGKRVAVIYFIPLEDRTELLVSFGSSLQQFEVPVPEKQLAATVAEFREKLVYYATDEYKTSGKQLYDWLIRPIETELAKHKVDTLVFVPDGVLRTVPMSALYDGTSHLIEKYAIAVSPGLTLMDATDLHRGNIKLLLLGLSEARENFSALPNVPHELQSVQNIFADSRELLNGQFVLGRVQSEFGRQTYTVVHIASHATFGADARKTYLLTYDDHLTLDGLEALIRPRQFAGGGERPVELLVLSACQTAAGDDRAALGLAGVAVKSGARSALATLWNVNDESSSLLICEFYRQLHDHPELSKAQAMRAAQLSLIHAPDPAFHHPSLWAPYLIIGNWL